MLIANKWKDYKILDTGDGEKLERVGKYTIRRPDSQVIWPKTNPDIWNKADAVYHRSEKGGGHWEFQKKLPETWTISYDGIGGDINLKFNIELTGFKHISLFPEQAVNWDYIYKSIKSAKRNISVLNLFAYTGAATVASAAAGAKEVVHVDAAKRIVSMAKENIRINNLENQNVRFMVDDVMKFVLREARRGRKYDAVIMDPPVYGRGPSGEMWQIEKSLSQLISACENILSDNPLFFIINCYTTGLSHISLNNILSMSFGRRDKGEVQSGEICIAVDSSSVLLPAGIYGRYGAV